jgi:hypothetical protein
MDGLEYDQTTQDGFTASSSNNNVTLLPEIPQQNELQSIAMQSSRPLSNVPNTVQYPSQEQWKEIRHVLQRMYIDEGRGLENVIRFLHSMHGLKVTYVCLY